MGRSEGYVELAADRRVHYVIAGDGPAVLCFPGNGCSVGDFDPIIDVMAGSYRFVGIDPPGAEPTVWPDETFSLVDDLPRVIGRVLAELGVGRHVAMGHSMGGMLALQHANQHRDQVCGLVLIEGFVTLAVHRATVAPDGFVPIRMAPDIEDAWRRRRQANEAWLAEHPTFARTFWASQQQHDARAWVADLDIPILVVVGRHGQGLPDDHDAWRQQLGMAGVEDLAVRVIPNAGHWMMLDDPAAVLRDLMPFLARATARPS